jgi:hypothetical protein
LASSCALVGVRGGVDIETGKRMGLASLLTVKGVTTVARRWWGLDWLVQ